MACDTSFTICFRVLAVVHGNSSMQLCDAYMRCYSDVYFHLPNTIMFAACLIDGERNDNLYPNGLWHVGHSDFFGNLGFPI